MRGADVLGPAALAAALLAAAAGLGRAADGARSPEARAAGGAPPLGILNVLAVDLLWLRADGLFAENRWPEMTAAYEMAGRLEPRLAASYEFRGFHLAYNLAGNAGSDEERDRWVAAGLEVLAEGLRRNPSSTYLRAYLGQVLFERSVRWPALAPKLRARRGRDPWDEAADLLGAVAAEAPDDDRAVLWLTDVLAARGMRTLDAATPGAPVPAAAEDFRRAAEALRALAGSVQPESRPLVEKPARGFDSLRRAAETSDPVERARILAEASAGAAGPGK